MSRVDSVFGEKAGVCFDDHGVRELEGALLYYYITIATTIGFLNSRRVLRGPP